MTHNPISADLGGVNDVVEKTENSRLGSLKTSVDWGVWEEQAVASYFLPAEGYKFGMLRDI